MAEEYIAEANANLTDGNLPAFYKYRYTFSKSEQDLDEQKNIMRYFINFIKTHYLVGDKLTAGIEHFTKGMVKTNAHMHIHFMSKSKSDTIRKGLMREYNLVGRCQSCKAEVIVDEPKFWRYPFKQQSGETKRGLMFLGFSVEDAKQMVDIAYACWKQSAEISIAKVEKKLERSSKDRLFSYLDNLDNINKLIADTKISFMNIRCAAYEYYVEHEETFCMKTVDGYVDMYLLKGGHISYKEFYLFSH